MPPEKTRAEDGETCHFTPFRPACARVKKTVVFIFQILDGNTKDFPLVIRPGNRVKVEAEFTGWAAKYVAERIWSPDQKITNIEKVGANKIILEFAASSEPEVIAWLLLLVRRRG